ncbi:MAG TPA: methyltransferase domain-containing protein [Acidimicrobiales bacterium]|nr:methyltransferase domain-containing protein [Acidimicrobiales bacterium]
MAQPHAAWATVVLDRVQLSGDEVVLDAGCGSGKVTEQLLARLPRGRVLGVDASMRMLAEARVRLRDHLDRVELLHADLTRPLPLGVAVDAVVSSATFHWIADHRALFINLAAILRPGGQLSVRCGGAGNIASVTQALTDLGCAGADPWHFATPEAGTADLAAAGFVDVRAWLTGAPVRLATHELESYLATVVLGAHLDDVPLAERADFVRTVAERLPSSTIDYVRLNLVARLSGVSG